MTQVKEAMGISHTLTTLFTYYYYSFVLVRIQTIFVVDVVCSFNNNNKKKEVCCCSIKEKGFGSCHTPNVNKLTFDPKVFYFICHNRVGHRIALRVAARHTQITPLIQLALSWQGFTGFIYRLCTYSTTSTIGR